MDSGSNQFLAHLLIALATFAVTSQATAQVDVLQRATMPTAVQRHEALTAREIIAEAHRAAGGGQFVNPGSLFLSGYNIIRRGDAEVLWNRYAMWREFATRKDAAHVANGKVRIEAWTDAELAMLISFDGEKSYDKDGPIPDQEASNVWSNAFGFGAIRHALDDGWERERRVDRLIDGAPAYMVRLRDPSGSETLFGVRQGDFAIVYVGFNTPRGWHERRYSHFFKKPDIEWKQAGRVRLFYDGQKSNEAVWTEFQVGNEFPDSVFVIEKTPVRPSF